MLAHPPGTVTLVPTGPLTNVALAVRKEPRIVERVAEVVLMGGAYGPGNRTPVSEFNIGCDPEAAQIVFREPWPLTMVGLDLTHQALATPEVVARIAALGTGPGRFVAELLAFFGAAYSAVHGFAAPPVHDPCAVAFVIDPDVLSTRRAPLDVELHGSLTAGMTVADLRGPEPADCHTRVAVTLDRAPLLGPRARRPGPAPTPDRQVSPPGRHARSRSAIAGTSSSSPAATASTSSTTSSFAALTRWPLMSRNT